jgi:hypothetical protein
MVQKEQNNALDALKPGSGARQKLALELCHKAGLVVEYLEERNEMSETPLIREAADGRERNVLLLLEAGADMDAKQENELAFTAMNQAAYFGNASCINYLLQFRADVNVMDGHGGTPLVAASLNGAVECVRLLLSNKADVNKRTKNGTTPLHKAAQRGHNKIIRMLIVEGADRGLKNGQNKTALELVDEHDAEQTAAAAKLLEEKKVGEKQEREAKYAPIFAQREEERKRKEEERKKLKEECKKSLRMTAQQIRAADWEEEKELDSGRKETHIRSFENQAHALRRELEEIIRVGDSEFCCEVEPGHRASDTAEMGQLDVIDKVVREFEKILAEHRSRDARWYNDGKPSQTWFTPNSDRARSLTVRTKSDGKYRSAVSEMLRFTWAHNIVIYVQGFRYSVLTASLSLPPAPPLCAISMKDNAKAVPRLTMEMYKEWNSKQCFLRQADRMACRERQKRILRADHLSRDRKAAALD